jgi:hypothetical protein
MNEKTLEFKINIKDTPKEYVDYLILALVHSGYEAYFDFDKEHVCFTGWSDEIIGGEIKEKKEN